MFKTLLFAFLGVFLLPSIFISPVYATDTAKIWSIQSIDTMKFSRDTARANLNNPGFDSEIDTQIKNIAGTGATHVAIGTPYDPEFYPFLTRWVAAARRYNLSVWFRGNWSGWEGWFNYPRLNRQQHLDSTVAFIKTHKSLFKDGDIFSSCPECENGGPGDPRANQDVTGHRQFLIRQYRLEQQTFKQLGLNVMSVTTMNADVAVLILDRATVQSLGGIVGLDHYVSTPEKLNSDIRLFATRTGGRIILGEFGAPIPDINGDMTPPQQAVWLTSVLDKLSLAPEVIGLNYWVNRGGSTALWSGSNQPFPAVAVLTAFYTPPSLTGQVTNEFGQPLSGISLSYRNRPYFTDSSGSFRLPRIAGIQSLQIYATGYKYKELQVSESNINLTVTLEKDRPTILYEIHSLTYRIWNAIISHI